MHPYIPFLLDDIKAAHRLDNPGPSEMAESFEDHIAQVEAYLNNTPEHTFGYYCGLKKEDFPPADQLTDEEMQLVNNAFEEMMSSWNLDISLPDNIPVPFAYQLIVDVLNKETMIVNSGWYIFDFCTGYAPDCELKAYCPCLKIWED